MPLAIEILAQARSDCTLFNDGERRGQGAGAQQDRKIVRAFDRKASGNLARATQNRFTYDRRGDHLIVEDDGKRLAHILLSDLSKFARARCVETKRHNRFVRALVEAGLCVREIAPRYEDALFDQIRRFWRRRAVKDFGVRRYPTLQGLFGRYRNVHHAKIKLGGFAEQFLQSRRILQTRHLHEDSVNTLTLNQRLDGPKFVDAAFNDLDRLFYRLADPLEDGRIGKS